VAEGPHESAIEARPAGLHTHTVNLWTDGGIDLRSVKERRSRGKAGVDGLPLRAGRD